MQSLLALVLLLFFSLDREVASSAEDGQFSYQGFAMANLTLDGLATVMPNGLLALTTATTSQRIGHAFHPAPIRFLTNSTETTNTTVVVRSFSTSFVFAIVSAHDILSGYGIAFVVAPTTNLSTADPGKYLGILNATNNTTSNHILAIELDTIMDSDLHDINSNHVGIDVNSLVSRQAKPAGYYDDDGIFQDLNLNSHKPMQVWVDYDSQARQLNVTLAPVHVPKPKNPLLSEAIDLSNIMADTMYIGFSSTTGVVASTHHYLLGWSFSFDGPAPPLDFSNLPTLPPIGPKPRSKILDVALPPAAALLIAAALATFFFLLWRRRRFAEVYEDWEHEFGPHRFAYRDLFHATDGFHDSNLLGVGGFGRVYKGVLHVSNLEIAVKRVAHDSRQGVREFIAEVVSIGRLRHRNLAQLLGYCRRKAELLLVYDFMPNGSLDKYLHNRRNGTLLFWPQRYRIIKGVASSLLYLHEGWEQVVIHRDIKASNVLLDSQMNGCLGDFGLARLYDHGTDAQTTHVVGTLGYLAPELMRTGKATPLTDVFAFGVFLLEVTCGRRPISGNENGDEIVLVDWVLEHQRKGSILDAMDPCLMGKFNLEEAILVLQLGLMCSHPLPHSRPSMRKVLQYLDGGKFAPNLSPSYVSYNTVLMQNKALDPYKVTCPQAGTSICTLSGESSVTVLREGR